MFKYSIGQLVEVKTVLYNDQRQVYFSGHVHLNLPNQDNIATKIVGKSNLHNINKYVISLDNFNATITGLSVNTDQIYFGIKVEIPSKRVWFVEEEYLKKYNECPCGLTV